jgi:methionine synthase II (cobalamin-independent)
VVGSWWLHPEYERDLLAYHDGKLSLDEAEGVLKRAATRAIKEQRDLGLDEWTGGEYYTRDFIGQLHSRLTGLQIVKVGEAQLFDYDDGTVAKVIGKIEAPDGLGYVAGYRREKGLPGGVTKAAVVSPNEVVMVAREDVEAINQQMPSLTAIVNKELRALADEGCPTVQLDAPMVGVLVNLGIMNARQAADFIASCFEGVNAKKSLHFCNGNLRGRPISGVLRCAPWVEVLQRLDGVIDIAAFEVKYFSQFQERESFKDMPKKMELACRYRR